MALQLFQLMRMNVADISTPDDIVICAFSNGLPIGEPSPDKAMLEARAAELQKSVKWNEFKFCVSETLSRTPLPPLPYKPHLFGLGNDNDNFPARPN